MFLFISTFHSEEKLFHPISSQMPAKKEDNNSAILASEVKVGVEVMSQLEVFII